MDNQKDYSCLERNSRMFAKNIDLDCDYQEALPAYCDDVFRIVKCVSRGSINSVDIDSDEIKILGKYEICVTYYNENSDLCYCDFEEEFVKSVNADNISENAFAYASLSEKYTNFRVINQRRIDIHSSGNIRLEIYDKVKCPCISSCSDAKLRKETIKCANIISTDISRIEFDEEFILPADSKPIKKIISSCANVTVSETKIIKDKALIKGNTEISVLYSTDDGIERAEYRFAVSKIIEVAGIEEKDIVLSDAEVSNLYLKAKATTGEVLNKIDIFGEISVSSLFIREKEEVLITDGYVIDKESKCTYSDYTCACCSSHIQECRMINLSIDLPDEVTEIKEVCIKTSISAVRNKRIVSTADINLLYINSSGELLSFSTSKDIEIPLEKNEEAIALISVQSYDYSINGLQLELRLNTDINAFAFNKKSISVLSDIEADDRTVNTPTLTVYFGRKNESVWNIAKSFSSDTDLIISENNLTSDILDSNKVLIIPKV